MFRLLTTLLLALSILGVATGGLLRPCDCEPEPEPEARAANCCACHEEAPSEPGPDVFRVCKRGPQPSAEPAEAHRLPAPDVHDVLFLAVEEAVAPYLLLAGVETDHRPPGDPGWIRSPAGLSRFLV